MLAAKEKTLNRIPDAISNPMASLSVRQRAATSTENQNRSTTKNTPPTVVNRISNYDFRTRKFSKSPIGTSVEIGCIVLVEKQHSPRKTIGENGLQLRRLQWAPGMSLYRGYFVPGGVDPLGLECGCSFWELTVCAAALAAASSSWTVTLIACVTCVIPGEGLGVGDAAQCLVCLGGIPATILAIDGAIGACEKCNVDVRKLQAKKRKIQEWKRKIPGFG